MIERLAEMLGAAAGAHVEAVRDEAGVERIPRHAADVAGLAVAFEAVQQHHFADGRAAGRCVCTRTCVSSSVRMKRFSIGKRRKIVLARPEIAEDREKVRIAEKRFEGPHAARLLFSQRHAVRLQLRVYMISSSSRTATLTAPSLRFRSSARITASARSRMERRSRRLSLRSRR